MNFKYILLIIFLCALTVRFAYYYSVDHDKLIIENSGGKNFEDARDYDYLAQNILDRWLYGYGERSSSYRPPLYPFFLASIYKIFGRNFSLIRIIQIIMGGVVCILIYKISSYLFDVTTGIVSSCFMVFSPYAIFFDNQLLSESLTTFLLVIFLYGLIVKIDKIYDYRLIFLGFIWGVCCLVKPVLLMVSILPTGLIYMIKNKNILSSTWFVLGVILVILPWSIRNYAIHSKFVPISTNGGYNFYLGNILYYDWSGKPVPEKIKKYQINIPNDSEIEKESIILSEVHAESYAYNAALNYMINEPFLFIKTLGIKFYDFWHIWISKGNSIFVRLILLFHSGVLIFAGFWGIFLIYKSGRYKYFCQYSVLYFLMVSSIYSIYISQIRFRVSLIEPMLAIFAGYALKSIFSIIRARSKNLNG